MSTTPPIQTAAQTVIECQTSPNGSGPHANGNGHHEAHPNGQAHHNRLTDLTISASPSPIHPSTHPPTHTSLTPHQLALLLRFFLDGSMTLLDVCEHAEISLQDLYAWARSPEVQEQFAMIRFLSALRDELVLAEGVAQARQTLVHLATIADPVEKAASRECRRKAASALIKQWENTNDPAPPRGGGGGPPKADEAGGGVSAPIASEPHATSSMTDAAPERSTVDEDECHPPPFRASESPPAPMLAVPTSPVHPSSTSPPAPKAAERAFHQPTPRPLPRPA